MGKAERRAENERRIEELLRPAIEAARRGDFETEEAAIGKAIRSAKKLPASLPEKANDEWPSYARRRVFKLTAEGKLRTRGDKPVAELRWMGGKYAVAQLYKDRLAVYTNTLDEVKVIKALDQHVEAALETLGSIIEKRRPTLTRMAMGSVLPGTALIPGLALAKSEFNDERQAFVSIVHPEWVFHLPIPPDAAPQAKPFVLSVRKAVAELAGPSVFAPPATIPALEQLERLVRLKDSGAIDDAEFARLKAQILGSG